MQIHARILFGALLAILFATSTVTAKEPSKKEIKADVETFLSDTVIEAVRRLAGERLARVDPAELQSPVKRALGVEKTCGGALKMAADYRVPGLFTSVRKLVDGEHETAVIEYMMTVYDKRSVAFVIKRWKAAKKASPSYTCVSESLKTHPVDLAGVKSVYKVLVDDAADDERRVDALEILRRELVLPRGITRPELVKQWKGLLSAYDADSKRYSVSGVAMTESNGLQTDGVVKRRGANFLLMPSGKIVFPAPEAWQDGKFTVTLWVRVIKNAGCEASLKYDEFGWGATHEAGGWRLTKPTSRDVLIPYKLNDWVKMEYVCTINPTAMIGPDSVVCRIMVGGKKLMSNGMVSGARKSFTVSAGAATLVVAGLQHTR